MKEENCIFCKIVNEELPSYKVYEDENFLAFLDIRPLNPGHTLVIPKEHVRWVWDHEDIGRYFEIVKKVANGIRSSMDTEQVVSLVFGEEVPHAHVWLVPRFKDDGHGSSIDMKNFKDIDDEEKARIADKIRNSIK